MTQTKVFKSLPSRILEQIESHIEILPGPVWVWVWSTPTCGWRLLERRQTRSGRNCTRAWAGTGQTPDNTPTVKLVMYSQASQTLVTYSYTFFVVILIISSTMRYKYLREK